MSKINVLGASCIDILVDHIDSKTFLSGKYKADRIKTSFGGDALNEAVVLSYLKEDVSISTVIADDPMGVLIQNFLEGKGITVSNPIKQNVETYLSLVLIDENGERHFIGSKNGSLRSYCLEDVCIDEDCKIVSFASMFISPLFDDEQMGKLFSLIKEKGILLCVDCSSIKNNEDAKDMSCLKYIDYFFCNTSEARALCHSEDIHTCEEILYQCGIKNVVIKMGEKGCLYKGKIYAPQRNIQCVDTTGAGDSFVAGFIHGLSQNEKIEDCIRIGNECGGRACEYVGGNEWTTHQ